MKIIVNSFVNFHSHGCCCYSAAGVVEKEPGHCWSSAIWWSSAATACSSSAVGHQLTVTVYRPMTAVASWAGSMIHSRVRATHHRNVNNYWSTVIKSQRLHLPTNGLNIFCRHWSHVLRLGTSPALFCTRSHGWAM